MYALHDMAMPDVERILDPDVIADASRAELEAVGLNRWGAMAALRALRGLGEAYSVIEGDDLLAVIGAHRSPHDRWALSTWFVGAQAYFDHPLRSVRYGRRFFRWLRTRHPECRVESESFSRHPQLARWFSLIGFNLEYRRERSLVFRMEPMTAVLKCATIGERA